jgi:hypothetical protein
VYGERWWKKEEMPMEFVNQFLLPERQDPNWSQGIPQSWMKKEWQTALMVIHRYITCEGRFSLVHLYHIRLLMHLNGDIPLCFPFFLLKILSKMSKRIQSHPATASKSLFHQRLIKTLVMYALGEVQHPWDWLIESLELEEHKPKHKTSPKQKSKKEKKVSKTPVVTVKESSPVARVTRSNKRKLLLQQETRI